MLNREKTSLLLGLTDSIETVALWLQRQLAGPEIITDVVLISVVLAGCADFSSLFRKRILHLRLMPFGRPGNSLAFPKLQVEGQQLGHRFRNGSGTHPNFCSPPPPYCLTDGH